MFPYAPRLSARLENYSTATTVFCASDASPVVPTIVAKQIIVNYQQWMTTLAVYEIQTLNVKKSVNVRRNFPTKSHNVENDIGVKGRKSVLCLLFHVHLLHTIQHEKNNVLDMTNIVRWFVIMCLLFNDLPLGNVYSSTAISLHASPVHNSLV